MNCCARSSIALLIVCSLVLNASAQAPDRAATNNASSLLQTGIGFERERSWIDAIRHYEDATRLFPGHSELRRRLLISRLHYDVVRRNSDSAIADMIGRTTVNDALDLYAEVLARLEMSYVERVNMHEIVRGGTAYLEVALTEPSFLKNHLAGSNNNAIEPFRTSIHRSTLARTVSNRFEARNTVARAAELAEREIGLSQTATVMQFVFGAVGLLDPYSSFLSSAELDEVESQIEGNFVGLGIALEPHESPLRILNVIEGGPAAEAGLMANDQILEIGSVRCVDVGAERAADMLRGPEKSHVRLLVARQGQEPLDVVIVRRRVEVPSVEGVKLLDPAAGIAYLKISSFQKTTSAELDEALWKLHRGGMQSLIIDLRGNPGGWLDASVAVADRFLKSGTIVSTRGKNGIENQTYVAHTEGTWQVPLTLLIDDQSASASEILAGAIRDNNRGSLVGQTSYGKGSVQGLFHTQSLSSGIRLTVSKFYSPSGRAISEQGVEPTLAINPDQGRFVAKVAASDSARNPSDRVLSAAIEQIRTRQAGLAKSAGY